MPTTIAVSHHNYPTKERSQTSNKKPPTPQLCETKLLLESQPKSNLAKPSLSLSAQLEQDLEETHGALENLKPALDNERGQNEEEEEVKGVKEEVEEKKVIRTRRHSPRVALTLQVKEERETSPEDSRKATRKVNPKFFGGAGGNLKGN